LEACWSGGTSLWASERVVFSYDQGSRLSSSDPRGREWELREREREREKAGWGGEGQESKVSEGNSTQSESGHQMLGKRPLTKKGHEKSLTSIQQSLTAGPNCQAGWGKDGLAPSLG
jgi:hypothetical protein